MPPTTSLFSTIYQNAHQDIQRRIIHACVAEKLIPYQIEMNNLHLKLSRTHTVIVKDITCFELRKFNLGGPIYLQTANSLSLLTNMHDLLKLLHASLKEDVDLSLWNNFVAEVNNCLHNLVAVEQFTLLANKRLANQIEKKGADSLSAYVSSVVTNTDPFLFFEQWAVKGHPYHPCHKTKLGLSLQAFRKFAPEFRARLKLRLATVHQSVMAVTAPSNAFNYLDWFKKTFIHTYHAWHQEINDKGLCAHEYYPIFVHPWQYQHKLKKLFPELIKHKQLFLNKVSLPYSPGLSFRTLIPDDATLPYIKLPVAIQSTSALRTISPASAQNGPHLSDILKKILQKENHFNCHLYLTGEIVGLNLMHDNPEIAKHLTILYRENPVALINKPQLPIVVAALFCESPRKKLPLIMELIHSSCGPTVEDAKKYFSLYCDVVLSAYFDLFLQYGIALEGHQQNTVMVFENYLPKHVIARDLGAAKVHMQHLNHMGFSFNPYPNSAIVTDKISSTLDNFIYTVLQVHLGEIVLLLAKHYDASESNFWSIIKQNLIQRFSQLKDKVDAHRWQHIFEGVLEDDWKLKGLLRMRLKNVANEYIYIRLANPLRDA